MSYAVAKSFNRKYITGYLLSCAVCLAYALFFEIRLGLTFFILMLVTPVLSIVWTSIALKGLQIEGSVSGKILSKGDTFALQLHLKQNGVLPLPLLRVVYGQSEHVQAMGQDDLIMGLGSDRGMRVTRVFTAKIWGTAQVGIEALEATDVMGFIRYTVRMAKQKELFMETVEILADIPDIPLNELLQESMQGASLDEDQEPPERLHHFAGQPGYEHREYVPGDDFKRINWKLSARHDAYMVRLDEPVASRRVNLVVDYMACDGVHSREARLQTILDEEKIVASVLAMMSLMMKQGLESTVFYHMDGGWRTFHLQTEEDLHTFRYRLTQYRFLREAPQRAGRMPDEAVYGGESILYFTNRLDSHVSGLADKARQAGTPVQLVVPRPQEKGYSASPSHTWLVNEQFEFSRIIPT
ncbi:DUF58 domain-containing protein [Gorillibacterium sp. sgz5001074]|uniref:DUF58 domain-containing protein n=1 Tax=Gorillibacterium sp. sgz5001074 TaxID=3446695 RepID=UPI003F68070D